MLAPAETVRSGFSSASSDSDSKAGRRIDAYAVPSGIGEWLEILVQGFRSSKLAFCVYMKRAGQKVNKCFIDGFEKLRLIT